MANLTARARSLAVGVVMSSGHRQRRRSVRHRTDAVQHDGVADGGGRTERQAQNRPQVVLELAGLGAFDGPVPGVVNARRHFVGGQLAILDEEFDRQQADVTQPIQQPAGVVPTGLFQPGGETGRPRKPQDAVAMMIFHQRIERGRAVAATRRQHGNFPLERHEAFQNQRHAAQRPPGRFDILRCAQDPLTLAIVAQPTGFQHCGQLHPRHGPVQILQVGDGSEGGCRDAQFPE